MPFANAQAFGRTAFWFDRSLLGGAASDAAEQPAQAGQRVPRKSSAEFILAQHGPPKHEADIIRRRKDERIDRDFAPSGRVSHMKNVKFNGAYEPDHKTGEREGQHDQPEIPVRFDIPFGFKFACPVRFAHDIFCSS